MLGSCSPVNISTMRVAPILLFIVTGAAGQPSAGQIAHAILSSGSLPSTLTIFPGIARHMLHPLSFAGTESACEAATAFLLAMLAAPQRRDGAIISGIDHQVKSPQALYSDNLTPPDRVGSLAQRVVPRGQKTALPVPEFEARGGFSSSMRIRNCSSCFWLPSTSTKTP
jgi:hypothetical protein